MSPSGKLPKNKKLVIFGIEDFAEIAYEYFTWDSAYEVVAFTVDREYIKERRKSGLPVVAFEDMESLFPAADHYFYAAVVYQNLNRTREAVCRRAKNMGYRLASYISSRCFVWNNAQIGEHCFIFENNSIQPFASIGENVVLWCNNQISHHSIIGSHCFLSGSVGVAGWVTVEDYCFIGINSTLANNTRLGKGSWVAHGTTISGNIPPGSFIKAIPSEIDALDESRIERALMRARQTRARLE